MSEDRLDAFLREQGERRIREDRLHGLIQKQHERAAKWYGTLGMLGWFAASAYVGFTQSALDMGLVFIAFIVVGMFLGAIAGGTVAYPTSLAVLRLCRGIGVSGLAVVVLFVIGRALEGLAIAAGVASGLLVFRLISGSQ